MKQKQEFLTSKYQKYIILFLTGAIVFIFGISFMLFINQTVSSVGNFAIELNSIRNFCTANDIVYQEIVRQLDVWESSFSEYQQFEVNGYRKFVAYESYDRDSVLTIFVPTAPTFPNRREGAKGYLYFPSGLSPSADWTTYFDITLLDYNVYCYKENQSR